MAHRSSRAFFSVVLISLPALAWAGGLLEAASADSAGRFFGALTPLAGLGAPSQPVPPARPASVAAGQRIDLGALHNRNLRAGLSAKLGGKNVWLSGVFDRGRFDPSRNANVEPNAYACLSVEGEPARLFDVKELLSNPRTVSIGSGRFKVKLAPDLGDPLASEIIVINLGDNHKDRISLRDLLKVVSGAGAAVSAGGRTYTVFYYDDIKHGKFDPARQLLAFLDVDGRPVMVPAEKVPSDRTETVRLLDDASLTLRRAAGQLLVFGAP